MTVDEILRDLCVEKPTEGKILSQELERLRREVASLERENDLWMTSGRRRSRCRDERDED